MIKHGHGSERIDVYSFGVVLWELATREEVHAHLSAAQVIHVFRFTELSFSSLFVLLILRSPYIFSFSFYLLFLLISAIIEG